MEGAAKGTEPADLPGRVDAGGRIERPLGPFQNECIQVDRTSACEQSGMEPTGR
jgi:hypothetical protein